MRRIIQNIEARATETHLDVRLRQEALARKEFDCLHCDAQKGQKDWPQ
jgi:hypothetical protein